MEGEEGSIPITTPTVSGPPHISNISPLGSPDRSLPSDDAGDRDLDCDNEPDREHAPDLVESSGNGGLTEDLKNKIVKQLEYYFSDENLPNDKYMMSLIKKNKEGFVPISILASFRRMKRLVQDHSLIVDALGDSSFLVVSSDGKRVKRLHPFEVRDPKLYTVLVENLPEDHSVENIRRIFGEVGNIKNVSIHNPHAIEGLLKEKTEKLISSKLHALVEYETVEAAERAVATFKDKQDWRNGMHVKLLKQMAKHGQRKQAWRDFPMEKSIANRGSDRAGEEEKHSSIENRVDLADEEDGENLQKEKNGQRGRNRGRSGRQKHRGHGQGHGHVHEHGHVHGHGTNRSGNSHEPSKPPPGPRMPDGTRGFTMGRGRPSTSNQN